MKIIAALALASVMTAGFGVAAQAQTACPADAPACVLGSYSRDQLVAALRADPRALINALKSRGGVNGGIGGSAGLDRAQAVAALRALDSRLASLPSSQLFSERLSAALADLH